MEINGFFRYLYILNKRFHMSNLIRPKVFVSYSWTNPEYEERVNEFVDRLRSVGIDTIYDKYDLEPGASTHAFMEKSVVDPSVTKVLILCDKKYVEKANAREGGAGTETLIISPKVYADSDPAGKNKKFIPIVMERDDRGKEYLPAYLDGRLYFDFSNKSSFNIDEFQRLVRYLYEKPERRAQALGEAPSYVTENEAPYFGTTTKSTEAIYALKNAKPNALTYCTDFFEQVYTALDNMIVNYDNNTDVLAESVWNHINNMLPLRNECLSVIETMLDYKPIEEGAQEIRTFLENLLSYKNKFPQNVHTEMQTDHFSFFVYEIFTYLITFLIERRKFNIIPMCFGNFYYKDFYGTRLESNHIFYPSERIFDYINNKSDRRLISFRAETVKNRCNYKRVDLELLMQTDLLLYIYHLVKQDPQTWWYPQLLLYREEIDIPFELFLRATSKRFYESSLAVIGISIDAFRGIKEELKDNRHFSALRWINLTSVSNIDAIATKD